MSETQQPGYPSTVQATPAPAAPIDTAPPVDQGVQVAPPETAATRPAYLENVVPLNVTGIQRPALDSCPKCTVGLLYVTKWDPDATHEIGQPIYFPQKLSGGSVARYCFNCGHAETVALNPTDAPPNPNPGA